MKKIRHVCLIYLVPKLCLGMQSRHVSSRSHAERGNAEQMNRVLVSEYAKLNP